MGVYIIVDTVYSGKVVEDSVPNLAILFLEEAGDVDCVGW